MQFKNCSEKSFLVAQASRLRQTRAGETPALRRPFHDFRGGQMGNLKTRLMILLVLATLIFGITGPTSAAGAEAKLAQVVYITKSKACGCAAKTVQAADALVNRTFTGSRQALLKRIDYDTDRQAAVPYIGEYHLIQLPALIFLDAQSHMLWMAVGEVAKEDVAAKLNQFGG